MTANVDADRWQRLAEVLDAALARDPNDWPEVLDAACVGAPDLRREAQELLERVDDARRFLASPPSTMKASKSARSVVSVRVSNRRRSTANFARDARGQSIRLESDPSAACTLSLPNTDSGSASSGLRNSRLDGE